MIFVKILKNVKLDGMVSKRFGYPITQYMSIFIGSPYRSNKLKIYRLLQEPEIIELSDFEWSELQNCLNDIY